MEVTSPTHCESHFVRQQYASAAHTLLAQSLHVLQRLAPALQSACAHVLVPPSTGGGGGRTSLAASLASGASLASLASGASLPASLPVPPPKAPGTKRSERSVALAAPPRKGPTP